METNRQKKIGSVLQKDLVDILQGEVRKNGITNLVISVSKVSVTTDLSIAKVFLSIFPQDKAQELLEAVKSNTPLIKHDLAQRVKQQLRKVPNLVFYIDDSLDYIEKIDNALSGKENPIENPDLLEKEKNHNLSFSFYIAKRYLRTSSKNNAINIITRIASLGIVVGAMCLFVVLSVFSGLKDFSLSFSNDFDPDLKIIPKYGKTLNITEEQRLKTKATKGIKFYSQIIEEKVLFLYKGKEQVAFIKGVDNQYNLVNNIQKTLYQGQWLTPKTPQVVVGNGISQKLSMGLFDMNNAFEIYVPRPGKGAITSAETAFNKSNLIPVGIYAINDELDSKYVFADLQLTQELLEYKKNQVTAVEIHLDSLANEKKIVDRLVKVYGENNVTIKNRAQLNDSLHKMLNTENAAIYLIFTLVIIMTLFTLAGAIIMMILDKQSNLKTLFSVGMNIKEIQNVFLLQGSILTIAGGLTGIFLGVIIVFIQQHFKVVMITESLPYPVIFNFTNVFIVFFTIFVLGFLASYIASSRVTKKLMM